MATKSSTSRIRGMRYRENHCLRIVRDVPPAPFGHFYPATIANTELNNDSEDGMPRTPCAVGGTLTVKSVIQCRKNHAQVLVVRAEGSEFGNGKDLIAKIYDEQLYVSESHRAFDNESDDEDDDGDDDEPAPTPALAAYSREAAAYKALNDKVKAEHDQKYARAMGRVPKYYGSWAVDATNNVSVAANPKLILLEYIKADSMEDFWIDDEDKRKNIMKQLIEAESDLSFYAGVQHDDLLPRNVLIQGDGDGDAGGFKVYIVDFDISRMGVQVGEKYQNPLYHWIRSASAWTAQGWPKEDLNCTLQWMWDTFGDNPDYYPATADTSNRFWLYPKK
ncbi:hypothetical protein BDV95DRAFT_624392 [Massariosphaeria phaeospora]|uniref:Protein kinase domain-containing protein n=1 Tax=Massariosphaeria phaeospora TaxID=100035 RepID=A0A7C8I4C3_9PLEO|nr:hypothetical protein BDV95DRAFT_624392 [Massariosphaeria phaeospora]